jgi:hypothetical protein
VNRQQLDSLIGLSVAEAEKNVIDAKLKPQSLSEDAIVPAITIASDIVRICYNENNVVTSAETQKSIDEKH